MQFSALATEGIAAFPVWDGVYCLVLVPPPPFASAKSRKQSTYVFDHVLNL